MISGRDELLGGIIRRLQRVEHRLEVIAAAEGGDGWQSLSYNSGWADYGAPYTGGEYRRVGDLVYVRGSVKRTSGSDNNIAVLPSDLWPVTRCCFVCSNPTPASFAAIRVDVLHSTGAINWLSAAGGAATWISLDGIVFSVS